MDAFNECHYTSADGLGLYARDYPGADADAPVLLCLHGLTRNSADFEDLAPVFAGRYRVIVPDQRGRGRSAWDSKPENYTPLTYVNDMFTLLDTLAIQRVDIVGTSMGGLMALLMAAMQPERVGRIVLNDVGPVVDPAGLARIQGYVGKAQPQPDWDAAAAQAQRINGDAFPNYGQQDWLRFARRTYHETESGLVANYDPAIATPIQASSGNAVPPDLWPVFEAIKQRPILVVRGAQSDILAPDCIAEMRRRKLDLQVVEVPGRGHAPMLDEAEAREALARFLSG